VSHLAALMQILINLSSRSYPMSPIALMHLFKGVGGDTRPKAEINVKENRFT
jgi:hypothetical protein